MTYDYPLPPPPRKTNEPVLHPMESAPRDGREVILKVKSRAGISGKYLVGHYMPGGHCIEDHPPIAEGWYFWNGREFDHAAEPIGWMPIPGEEYKFPVTVMTGLRPVIRYLHEHGGWRCTRADEPGIVGEARTREGAYRDWLSRRKNDV